MCIFMFTYIYIYNYYYICNIICIYVVFRWAVMDFSGGHRATHNVLTDTIVFSTDIEDDKAFF